MVMAAATTANFWVTGDSSVPSPLTIPLIIHAVAPPIPGALYCWLPLQLFSMQCLISARTGHDRDFSCHPCCVVRLVLTYIFTYELIYPWLSRSYYISFVSHSVKMDGKSTVCIGYLGKTMAQQYIIHCFVCKSCYLCFPLLQILHTNEYKKQIANNSYYRRKTFAMSKMPNGSVTNPLIDSRLLVQYLFI